MQLTDQSLVKTIFGVVGMTSILLAVILIACTSCQNANVSGLQEGLNRKQLEAADELFRAAASGDTATVNELLDKGGDVNVREEEGETPLMYAAAEGHTNVVVLLMDRGAEINALSKNQETALGRAARLGHEEIVRALIDKGADIELGGRHATTPLMAAASQDKTGAVRVLTSKGALVNSKDDLGNTALMYAIIGNASINTIKALLEAGADAGAVNNEGVTPLTLALKRSDKRIVELLRAKLTKR